MHGQPSQGTFGATLYLLRAVFALTLAVMRRAKRAPAAVPEAGTEVSA
ncbi:MAG: hypothetical protein GX871_07830 [Microbacteriaceae bacterium]|nr:hypothetical protein [Microbacteriaceae bacterium]